MRRLRFKNRSTARAAPRADASARQTHWKPLFAGGLLLYRRTMGAIAGIEVPHVAPAAERVNAILDDVKGVTSVVKEAVDDANAGARWGLGWLINRLRPERHAA